MFAFNDIRLGRSKCLRQKKDADMRSLLVFFFIYVLIGLFAAGRNELPELHLPENGGERVLPSVELAVAGGQLNLAWGPVAGAVSYTVYSSDGPQEPFAPDLTGAYADTIWTAPLNAEKRFYYVTWSDSFILVEGGTFYNGIGDVTLTSFLIDTYEVTQKDYLAVMGTNPSYGFGVSDDRPVYNVSWFNAVEYCNRLSLLNGLAPCYSYLSYGAEPSDWPPEWDDSWSTPPYNNHQNFSCDWAAGGYRLPTDMEWEFAARGGVLSQGYVYSGSNTLGDVGWYNGNAGYLSHPVGSKAANELGFHDLSGNVGEWTWDIFASLPVTPQTDPHGAASGNYRTFRNGYFNSPAANCATTYRAYTRASTYSAGTGFRICRRLPV